MRPIIATLVLAFVSQVAAAASPIAGGWYYGPGYPSDNGVVLTFFDDGIFYLSEDGVADAGGGPGMERGTYAFDPIAETLTATVLDDTTGDWSLSDATITKAVLDGDTLTVTVSGEPLPLTLARVADPAQAIVGSWYTGPANPHDDGLVITFLPQGNYFVAHDGIADAGGGPGMERGDYAWNGANGITFNGGALQGAPWRSTIGDWGLANTNILGVAISGDLMTLDVEGEGPIEFTRVAAAPVPEPGSFALMLAGAGLLGAAVRLGRRRP